MGRYEITEQDLYNLRVQKQHLPARARKKYPRGIRCGYVCPECKTSVLAYSKPKNCSEHEWELKKEERDMKEREQFNPIAIGATEGERARFAREIVEQNTVASTFKGSNRHKRGTYHRYAFAPEPKTGLVIVKESENSNRPGDKYGLDDLKVGDYFFIPASIQRGVFVARSIGAMASRISRTSKKKYKVMKGWMRTVGKKSEFYPKRTSPYKKAPKGTILGWVCVRVK